MKKRKNLEDFLKVMEEGNPETTLILDREGKFITREDNGKVVAILDKSLNPQKTTV